MADVIETRSSLLFGERAMLVRSRLVQNATVDIQALAEQLQAPATPCPPPHAYRPMPTAPSPPPHAYHPIPAAPCLSPHTRRPVPTGCSRAPPPHTLAPHFNDAPPPAGRPS